jgi:hypothetical protein
VRALIRLILCDVLGGNSEEFTSVNGERLGSTATIVRTLGGCTSGGGGGWTVVGMSNGLNPSVLVGVDGTRGGVTAAPSGVADCRGGVPEGGVPDIIRGGVPNGPNGMLPSPGVPVRGFGLAVMIPEEPSLGGRLSSSEGPGR